MLRRNGPVMKSVESVLRPEGSLWGERFVEEVGLEPGVKERGSYGWWEWWVEIDTREVQCRRPPTAPCDTRPTEYNSLHERIAWTVWTAVTSYTMHRHCWKFTYLTLNSVSIDPTLLPNMGPQIIVTTARPEHIGYASRKAVVGINRRQMYAVMPL